MDSRTNPCRSALSVKAMGRAAICPVSLSLAPTTATLPTVPRPARSFLLGVLVTLLASDVGLVYLDRSGKLGLIVLPSLADAVR